MRAQGWLTVLAAMFATACVESSVVVCGDNVCPPDTTCHAATGLCVPKACGDGEITGTEECDGANLGGRDCTYYGYYDAGSLECSPVCAFVESSCIGAGICGDHDVNGEELCDGTPTATQTCTDFGFDIGRLGCNAACSPAFEHCDTVGWHVTASDEVTPWRGLWGASENALFAVGDYGRVFRSNGSRWEVSTTSTTAQLNHVWGTSATDVFAVGDAGTIVHFDGATWTTMVSGTTERLSGVWGRAGNDVYAVGDRGTILHYNGSAWAVDASLPPHDLYAVYGDANRVFAVGSANGNNAAIAKIVRKEGTAAWATETPPPVLGITKYGLYGLWGDGTTFVAVGGEFGLNNGQSVLLTWNADTWTSHVTGEFGEMSAVFGRSPTDVIMGGHNGLVLRFDGAKVHRVMLSATRAFSEFWGAPNGRMWASSFGSGIWTTDGVEWRAPVEVGASGRDLSDVFRFESGDLLIGGFGSAEQLTVVVDGVPISRTLGARDISAVWDSGVSPYTGHTFVATEEGVWHDDHSDGNDYVMELSGFYLDVFGTSASNVYAVGGTVNQPFVQRYNGTSWSALTVPANTGLRPLAVWASGPNDVFIVGNDVIMHSTDGTTFTQMAADLDPSIVLRAVWGTGPTDVFASGDNGTILHYDGSSWRRMTYSGTEVLLSLAGTGPDDVFAAGTGLVLHYDGISWSELRLPVPFNTTGAQADDRGIVFTGFLGQVLQLDRVCQPSEEQCGDTWDNDCDGALNCADTDCADSQACRRGGACSLEPVAIACNESRRITTFTGVSRVDDWSCVTTPTAGSEVSLRFDAPASGQVTFDVSDVVGEAQLLVLDADVVATACDVSTCQAASNGSLTKAANGTPMYVVVDAPAGKGAELTLTTSCN